jgi:hypothetical protein
MVTTPAFASIARRSRAAAVRLAVIAAIVAALAAGFVAGTLQGPPGSARGATGGARRGGRAGRDALKPEPRPGARAWRGSRASPGSRSPANISCRATALRDVITIEPLS